MKKEGKKGLFRKFITTIAAAIGASAIFGGVSLAKKQLLPEGNNQPVQETTGDQPESKDSGESFKGTLVYKDGITEKDVDEYLKNFYIEEYEKTTGDDTLIAEDIEISKGHQNYIFQLDDGTLVTHGEKPYETQKSMEEDGQNYSTSSDKDTLSYSVRKKTNDEKDGKDKYEIIDIVVEEHGELKKAIPGDRYEEMKDYTSTLELISDVLEDCYYLKSADKDRYGNINFDNIKLDEENKKLIQEIKEYMEESAQKRDLPEYQYDKDDKSDAR